MRLAMSILVRDESDVIEDNIRHHSKLGVSKFIVTDNGSVDGTREILEKLSGEYDLTIIDEPSKTIDQDIWVTRMADIIKAQNTADWLINNDADEFWHPIYDESLPIAIETELEMSECSSEQVGVMYCGRQNFVGSQEIVEIQDYTYKNNRYKVVKDWSNARDTLNLDEHTSALLPEGKHVIIRTLPGKVITRLSGLESIGMGNHGAKHNLDKISSKRIKIQHFPIRTYEQFKQKVVNYGSSLENNERFGEQTSLHLRLWYESYKSGKLRDVYDAIVLPDAMLKELSNEGVLCESPVDG